MANELNAKVVSIDLDNRSSLERLYLYMKKEIVAIPITKKEKTLFPNYINMEGLT